MSNEKTIKLLLKDGTLSGQIYAKNSDWNPGVLHVYPRNQGNLLIFQKELNNIWTEKTGGTR